MQPALSAAPFTSTDVLAGVLLILALLYTALWRRDRERGMGWFALAMLLLGLWIGADRLHAPTAVQLQASWWYAPLLAGIAALCIGLVDYLDVPRRARLGLLAGLLAPLIASAGIAVWVALTGTSVPRATVGMLATACFVGLGGLALWASRREPGAGHALVGAALLAIPGLALLLWLAGSASTVLRYWSYWPLLVLGMTLLTVSLLRRRRLLEAEIARRRQAEAALTTLNASLETEVDRRTRELREMVAALESFNRSVSHDLRGPLGGIGGLARLADEALAAGDVAAARRWLGPIVQQADASSRLVGALLALSHADDAPLQRQPVNLRALAQEALAVVGRPQAGAAAVEVEVEVGPLPTVPGDPDLLRTVFANLLGNALKFSAGRADALVSVSAEQGPAFVTVQVRDNGVGFDSAQGARLFKPFTRLADAAVEGHGVGLSIVRRVVERHGGSVRADSQPGAGATFSFTLPAQG